MKKLGIFLVMVALIAGMVGCEPLSCGGGSSTPVQYDLTIYSTTGGSVTTPGEGTLTYDASTVVDLVAVAEECYEFVNWTGDTVADPDSATTTITMNGNYSITANFALLSYDLTVDSTDDGEVTAPGEGTSAYDCGTVVDLVAAAEEGYYFVNWTGDVDTIANINAPTTTITMNGDYSITANFEQIPPGQFALTTSSTAGGSVTTPGEGTSLYDEGTVADLVAEAEECYEFVNWTGDTVANPDSATTTITMDGAKDVTANFALLSYNLTADSTDDGEVITPGEGTSSYDCGTVVDLVAEAEEGYSFVEWTGDVGTIANIDAAETTITMNDHYSITANFGPFAGGSGTAEDPYQLADWYNLDNLRNYLSSYFILTNDLDFSSIGYTELASETGHEGKGWEPIGNLTDPFAGSFNGQGYQIHDLFIDRPDESDVGLFGILDVAGLVENVGVVNGNVTGDNNAGGLVGRNDGTIINNCYYTGNVTGNANVGGLAGYNFVGTASDAYSSGIVTGQSNVGGLFGWDRGTTSDSYSTSSVTGNTNVGGLTGKNSGTASNSYATGSVTGDDNVGGLIGRNDAAGTASNCYSTGSVTGNTNIGGLMGRNFGTESNSFWDTETSGQAGSDGGTGKTTAEMQSIATFLGATWDIIAVANPGTRNPSYIWNIVDDETYPFLSWQPV